MPPPYWIPTFQFEENRLVHSLRLLVYPGDAFTSEQSCRCAFAVVATRRGDRVPPPHEKDLDEWNRVLDALLAAEPTAWIRRAIEERQEEAAKEPPSTQL
jgi:hypothetical protein